MIYARLRICFEITKIVTRMERDELHSPSRQIKTLFIMKHMPPPWHKELVCLLRCYL